jgi:cation:H+ antiporter
LLLELLIFGLGVALLVGGAWLLVTGGARIAALLGVAPVVIGLTIVAFGTSAPEFFVCLVAALRGNADLTLGNIVGSNLANIGLILGLAVLLMPVVVERGLVRVEIPLLLVATLLFSILCWDQCLSRVDGIPLVLLFAVFILGTIRSAMHRPAPAEAVQSDSAAAGRYGILINSGFVVLGIAGLTGGGHLLVSSAVKIATRLGASEALIGLTLVAVGTSLPELATTAVAAIRRQSGIALGNVIGSNLFNLLAVAGSVCIIQPLLTQPNLRTHQLPGMVLLTLTLPFLVIRREVISRAWGGTLLILYSGVMIWWIWNGV